MGVYSNGAFSRRGKARIFRPVIGTELHSGPFCPGFTFLDSYVNEAATRSVVASGKESCF